MSTRGRRLSLFASTYWSSGEAMRRQAGTNSTRFSAKLLSSQTPRAMSLMTRKTKAIRPPPCPQMRARRIGW